MIINLLKWFIWKQTHLFHGRCSPAFRSRPHTTPAVASIRFILAAAGFHRNIYLNHGLKGLKDFTDLYTV